MTRPSPKVGSRVRFRLYMGRYEEGIIRAILNTGSGTKLRVEYGRNFATIKPEAIIQPEKPDAPKDVEF
jgi:hypothetical protein